MAITRLMYQLLKEHRDYLPRGGSLLEIGEANWYGDAPASVLMEDATDDETREMVRDGNRRQDLFALARAAYYILFRPSVHDAIDLNGTPKALRKNLNSHIGFTRWYDVVINNGTLEHVFNIGRAFENVHNACTPGGIIIHDAPFNGWVDHGFYTLQPTLFYDLAHANDYDVISVSIIQPFGKEAIRVPSREAFHELKDIPNNAQLFVVLRKTADKPFRVPMQGIYDGRLSEKGQKAWQDRREVDSYCANGF